MADDRLDEQPGQRRGDPQARQLLDILAQRLEDAAHIRILQREADLDAEKAEADIPQAGKTLPRLVHVALPIGRSAALVGRGCRSVEGREQACGRWVYEYVAGRSLFRSSCGAIEFVEIASRRTVTDRKSTGLNSSH